MYKCPNCEKDQEAAGVCTECGGQITEENKVEAGAEDSMDQMPEEPTAQ